eukprot:651994-Pyramimonas_sp.AAC.3
MRSLVADSGACDEYSRDNAVTSDRDFRYLPALRDAFPGGAHALRGGQQCVALGGAGAGVAFPQLGPVQQLHPHRLVLRRAVRRLHLALQLHQVRLPSPRADVRYKKTTKKNNKTKTNVRGRT